jgi:hypothetical protein
LAINCVATRRAGEERRSAAIAIFAGVAIALARLPHFIAIAQIVFVRLETS